MTMPHPDAGPDGAGDFPSVTVVIPAYNEEESIGVVVRRVVALGLAGEIVVVDDGSTDATAVQAAAAGARVLRHERNMGNGASVKDGCLAATREWIVLLDADGQHPPEEIPKLMRHCDRCDMVIGTRTKESNVSRFRSFGNWGLRRFAEFLLQEEIPDLTSGFRAIRRERLLTFLHLFPRHYSYPTTITMAFVKAGLKVHYEALPAIQGRKSGRSRVRPLRDGFRFLNIMMRMTMLFNPQRIFVPVGLGLVGSGCLFAIYQIVTRGGVLGASLVLFLSGVFTFMFGLLADQVSAIRLEMTDLGRPGILSDESKKRNGER